MATAALAPPTNFPGGSTLPLANVRRPNDFPADQFTTIPNVPVFAEHETTTKKGRKLVFGPRELQLVCDRCNRRIQETGDYAVICIGHTPSPMAVELGTAVPPVVVGFAGPWRMGVLALEGQRRRAVICCDWHIYTEDVGRLKRYPRRSPELWIEEKFDDMFLDPIALLGYEAPRLDQGLLYSALVHRGAAQRELEKYTAAAPSAANVFIPSGDWRADDQARRYAAHPEEAYMPVDQETIAAIVTSLQELPVFQWAKAKMEAEASPAADAGIPGAGAAPVVEPQKNNAGGGAQPETVPPASAPPITQPPMPAGGAPPEREKNAAGAGGPTVKKFKADDGEEIEVDSTGKVCGRTQPSLPDTPKDEPEKYSRLNHQVTQLTGTVQQLQQELQVERAARVDAQRLTVLQNMQFEGYAIKPRETLEKMNYSKMPAAQFDEQIALLRETCARSPVGMMLPIDAAAGFVADVGAGNAGGPEKYSKEHSDRAREICEQAALQGKSPDYADVLARVRRGESVTV